MNTDELNFFDRDGNRLDRHELTVLSSGQVFLLAHLPPQHREPASTPADRIGLFMVADGNCYLAAVFSAGLLPELVSVALLPALQFTGR